MGKYALFALVVLDRFFYSAIDKAVHALATLGGVGLNLFFLSLIYRQIDSVIRFCNILIMRRARSLSTHIITFFLYQYSI